MHSKIYFKTFCKVLKISGLKTFLIYLLITHLSGEDCREDALLQMGMKRKQQPRKRARNECCKSTDTLLKFWPFWQLLASRWHCVRTMTIIFQAVHCLQETRWFFSPIKFFKNEELFTAARFMDWAQQLHSLDNLKMKLTLTFSLFLSKLAVCIPSRIAGEKQCPVCSGLV